MDAPRPEADGNVSDSKQTESGSLLDDPAMGVSVGTHVLTEEQRQLLCQRIREVVIDVSLVQPENLGSVTERAGAAVERALAEGGARAWIYLRVPFDDMSSIVPREIVPAIEELRSRIPINGWWWLYKNDPLGRAVRLRVLASSSALDEIERELSSRLTREGRVIRRLCYEPEVCLFGGPEGMRVAHALFCYDSEFLAAWAKLSDPLRIPTIPAGLSIALIIHLLQQAGVDTFECWDVFDRVSDKRALAVGDRALEKCARMTASALEGRTFPLHSGECATLIERYASQLKTCGERLCRVNFEGRLECGVREFLAAVIIFQWNRAGFRLLDQAAMAHGAANEFKRLSRKGSG